MNAADAIEKLNHWEQLADGTLDEQAYFCRRVKPLIPELRVLVIEQHGRIVQLTRELTGARADAAEYKTRAESQGKTNVKLQEDFTRRCAELGAEIDAWKKKDSEAKGRIDAYVETITELRADLAQQKLQIDSIKSKVVNGVRILNDAANC